MLSNFIEPPSAGYLGIDAWSIETFNNEELHERWSVAVGSLRDALDNALAEVTEWKMRNLT
jgi:hypothetical protein